MCEDSRDGGHCFTAEEVGMLVLLVGTGTHVHLSRISLPRGMRSCSRLCLLLPVAYCTSHLVLPPLRLVHYCGPLHCWACWQVPLACRWG